MIIVNINNVLVISCLSTQAISYGLVFAYYTIGIHIADLYSTKEVFGLQVTFEFLK